MFLAVLGPGIITMVADNDAGGISTYSITGAQYGFSLLWILVVLLPVAYFIQEMTVRLGAVTKRGHAEAIFEGFGKFYIPAAFWAMKNPHVPGWARWPRASSTPVLRRQRCSSCASISCCWLGCWWCASSSVASACPRFAALEPIPHSRENMGMRFSRLIGVVFCVGLLVSCRKQLGDGTTSQRDVDANLDGFIDVVKSGLGLSVNARFLTFGPVPGPRPWDNPAAATSVTVQGQNISLRPGRDGLVHERYEARPCPLKPIFECVEILATGRFGRDGEIMCFGLQLQKHPNEVVRQDIAFRSADYCPFQMSPGPAQQIIRGIEKAQLEHFQRQETDKYLDPSGR